MHNLSWLGCLCQQVTKVPDSTSLNEKEQQLSQREWKSHRASAHSWGVIEDPGSLFLLYHPQVSSSQDITCKQDNESFQQQKRCVSSLQLFVRLRNPVPEPPGDPPASVSSAGLGHMSLLKAITGKGTGSPWLAWVNQDLSPELGHHSSGMDTESC